MRKKMHEIYALIFDGTIKDHSKIMYYPNGLNTLHRNPTEMLFLSGYWYGLDKNTVGPDYRTDELVEWGEEFDIIPEGTVEGTGGGSNVLTMDNLARAITEAPKPKRGYAL